jgi:hypothetical protein
MSDSRSAGCACGAVEIRIEGDPAAMAYCHCDSCRSWLGAPIHAASLWPTDGVTVTKGEEKLGVYKRTEASHRYFCTSCGAPVLVRHPQIGLTDVPAGSVRGLAFAPSMHVHYGEKVLSVRDGLPKYADMPSQFGGSGKELPD